MVRHCEGHGVMPVLGHLCGVTPSLGRKMRKTPGVEQTPGLTAGKSRKCQKLGAGEAGACPAAQEPPAADRAPSHGEGQRSNTCFALWAPQTIPFWATGTFSGSLGFQEFSRPFNNGNSSCFLKKKKSHSNNTVL